MMPKAHMPETKILELKLEVNLAKDRRTSKGKGKLEERNSGSTTRTEAMGHDIDIGMTATEFGVNNNKTDGPVCDGTQCHE